MKSLFTCLALLLLSTTSIYALEGSMPTKTPAEIDAYKREMRAIKTPTIAAEREQTRLAKQPTIEAIQAEQQERKQAVIENRCQLAEARINHRLNLYQEKRDFWYSRHQGVISRLSGLVEKLQARGCNTTVLSADITAYQELVAGFAAAFRDFHTTLTGTKKLACGESDGAYIAEISAARGKHQVMVQSANDLKNFFQNTLRRHLRTAAQTCPASTPTQQEVTNE